MLCFTSVAFYWRNYYFFTQIAKSALDLVDDRSSCSATDRNIFVEYKQYGDGHLVIPGDDFVSMIAAFEGVFSFCVKHIISVAMFKNRR